MTRFIYVVIFTVPLGIAVGAPIPWDSPKGKERAVNSLSPGQPPFNLPPIHTTGTPQGTGPNRRYAAPHPEQTGLLPADLVGFQTWLKGYNGTCLPLHAEGHSTQSLDGLPRLPHQPSDQGHSTLYSQNLEDTSPELRHGPSSSTHHSGNPPRAEGHSIQNLAFLDQQGAFPERHGLSAHPQSSDPNAQYSSGVPKEPKKRKSRFEMRPRLGMQQCLDREKILLSMMKAAGKVAGAQAGPPPNMPESDEETEGPPKKKRRGDK